MLSGNSVINNTFRDCETGVLIGGGRHHTVRGNTFENVGDAQGGQSVWIDSRGLTCGPGANPNCRYNGTFHN
jgi:parallel beta-helix repeat protein